MLYKFISSFKCITFENKTHFRNLAVYYLFLEPVLYQLWFAKVVHHDLSAHFKL